MTVRKASDPPTIRRLRAKRELRLNIVTSGGSTWSHGLLWVVDTGADQLIGIDRDTGTEVRRFHSPEVQGGIAADGDALWLIAGTDARLRRLDPETGNLIDERPVAIEVEPVARLAWSDSGLCCTRRDRLAEFDPDEQHVSSIIGLDEIALDVEIAEGAIWYLGGGAGSMVRADRRTGVVLERLHAGDALTSLCYDGRLFWIIDRTTLRAVRP